MVGQTLGLEVSLYEGACGGAGSALMVKGDPLTFMPAQHTCTVILPWVVGVSERE